MRACVCFAIVVVSSTFGQVGVTGGNGAFTCNVNTTTPPTIRLEGITELVGDIVLTCQGGTPLPAGTLVPQTNINFTLNTPITSRTLNPNTPQLLCPSINGCTMTSSGVPAGAYNGITVPNVFQGAEVGSNQVTFFGVPIVPPSTTGRRIFRITNVRANANALQPANGVFTNPFPITGTVVINGTSITIPPVTVTVGSAQPSATVTQMAPFTGIWCNGDNGNQISGGTSLSSPSPPVPFSLRFYETFGGAFKTQGTPTIIPGGIHTTESGFTPSGNQLPGAGMANTGTILQVVLPNMQPGSTMTVPAQMNLVDTVTGGFVGYFLVSSPTVPVIGTILVAKPDSTGTVTLNGQLMQRTSFTNPVFADFPLLVGGTFSALQTPWYGEGLPQYPPQQITATSLFTPGSSNAPAIPSFDPLTLTISDVLNPGTATADLFPFTVASGCESGSSFARQLVKPELSSTGAAAPAFIGVTGGTEATTLISPVVSNVGVVSSVVPAATGITLTQDPTTKNWLNVGLSGTTTPATLFLSVNYMPAGSYSTTLQLSAPGGLTLSVPVSRS